MTAATSLLSYQDCIKLMEKAHEYKEGVRVKFSDANGAGNFRMRMHKARALDRAANAELYQQGHKLHGRSVYDDLFLTIRFEDGHNWLYCERRQIETMEIQPLGDPNEQQGPTDGTGGEVQREDGEGGGENEVEELFAPQDKEKETAPTRRF